MNKNRKTQKMLARPKKHQKIVARPFIRGVARCWFLQNQHFVKFAKKCRLLIFRALYPHALYTQNIFQGYRSLVQTQVPLTSNQTAIMTYSHVRISQQARNFLACWVRPNFWWFFEKKSPIPIGDFFKILAWWFRKILACWVMTLLTYTYMTVLIFLTRWRLI